MTRGKVWATAAFLLGIGVSVAANVAHTWHPSIDALKRYAIQHHGSVAGWHPELGAQIGAAAYPIALLLTVEMLSRIAWPAGRLWQVTRFGGAGMVALVSGIVSYRHMAALLSAYGEDRLTAAIGPLAIDGLMVIASMALLASGRENTAVVWETDVPRVVSEPETVTFETPTDPFPEDPSSVAWLSGLEPRQEHRESGPETVPGDEDQAVTDARTRFRDVLGAGSVPSIRTIKRELRVGYPKAKEIHAVLAESA